MERFLQYTFDGLSEGSVYALLALGLVIIYRGTGHLNFAHGEMGLLSAYTFWQLHDWGVPVGVAFILGVAFGFVLGSVAEVALVRPVGQKSQFAVFIVTIGLFIGLNWLCTAVWGPDALPKGATGKQVQFPQVIPNGEDFVDIGGATWRYKYLGVLIVTLLLTAAVFALFKYTKLGLAMRAVASNTESSKLVGVKTNTVLMVSWGLAVAIGAVGAILWAGVNGQVNANLMFTVFLYASAAATLGGFDSPGGAIIGGLAIGLIENYLAQYQPDWIGQELGIGVVLMIILGVLLVRPSGLFGTAKVERV